LAEANRAAEVLGAHARITLDLPNRRLFDTFEARLALAKVFRRYRPRLVLSLGSKTPLASPDHYQAMLITEAAVFYTKLTKWEQHFEDLPPCAAPVIMYYFLALRSLSPAAENGLVVDIGDALEKKLSAIACYETQFGGRSQILDRLRTFNQQHGQAAGFSAGEVLASPATLGTRDLMGMLFS
jgi:LmbE family N-acetylglucosaminyl deacetylase